MSIAPPAAPPPSRFRLSPRARRLLLAGFGLGLLLFLLLWWDLRDNADFYRPEASGHNAEGQVFDPLPAPMPDGERSASGLSEAAEAARRNPPPAPPVAKRPTAPAVEAPQTAPSRTADARPRTGGGTSLPAAISRPAPEYPAQALRNNESGTVHLRITVGEDGKPSEIVVERSSRSRALDRAAVQAVRRWTFRPAMQDGRPVAGELKVPIEFSIDNR
jgi:protein TonB